MFDINEPNREQKMTKAYTDIRALYLSGAPLFTKESLRHIKQQLKDLEGKSGTVHVQGLDGSFVEIPIKTGEILSYSLSPREFVQ